MTVLLDLLSLRMVVGILAIAVGLAVGPGLLLRCLCMTFPPRHERRRELLAELVMIPLRARPAWVLGHVETVWQEAPAMRREWRIRNGMRREIRVLPDHEKLVLSLYYDEGLSHGQIADVLGVSELRASVFHTNALAALADKLGRRRGRGRRRASPIDSVMTAHRTLRNFRRSPD